MASAVAIKNTFLQFEGSAAPLESVAGGHRNMRPRGLTFDASQLATSRPFETKTSSGDYASTQSGVDDDSSSDFAEGANTTIMLRNIPNKYTQKMLLEVIEADFQGLFNFFYLPIDFKNKCNVGYAFLNFIEPHYCQVFWNKFSGRRLTGFKSKKVCDVSWGRVQGLKSNLEHYRNSSIMSLSCQDYKPLLFKRGQPVPFPPPKKSHSPAPESSTTDTATSSASPEQPQSR